MRCTCRSEEEACMSESMTRLERVEADVENAQAALGLVGGVIHTAVKVKGAERGARKLVRGMSIVGGVVALGVVVIVSRRRRAAGNNAREVTTAMVDVDGDGRADVFRQTTTTVYDIDGDGVPDIVEQVTVTGTDLNGDGVIDDDEISVDLAVAVREDLFEEDDTHE
jgi:hypothetical protein